MTVLPSHNQQRVLGPLGLFVCIAFLVSSIFAIGMLCVWNGGYDVNNNTRLLLEAASVFLMCITGTIFIFIIMARTKILRNLIQDKETVSAELERKITAIDACIDGVIIVDPESKLTYMNRSFMDLHDIEPADIELYIGHDWFKVYEKEGVELLDDIVLPALNETGYWKDEVLVSKIDGKNIYAETALTMLLDGSIIVSERDITAYRNAEIEREVLQKQFFQSQKMEAVGRLAGGVAHDFNNILSSISGYSEFLLEDLDEDTKQHQFSWQIMQGCMQAKKLVEQILTFSRHGESSLHVMDVVSTVHQTVGMLRSTLPSTIELKTCMDVDEAFINGNISQVTQNVMNLCINAMDAIESGHGVMEIKLQIIDSDDFEYKKMLTSMPINPDDPPMVRLMSGDTEETATLQIGYIVKGKEYVCLSVIDSGVGMSYGLLEHIFDPFFTTKSVGKGTGLGLASVHGVMAVHSGAIVVVSTVGKGTSINLYFPIAEGRHSLIVKDKVNVDMEGSGNILIVEDQEEVRDMIEEMLSRIGYSLHVCSSSVEAIDHLREMPDKYDLVLTDHVMPSITGIELARIIGEDFPDLPVVVMSGYSKQKLETEMEKIPAIKAVLRKPIDSSTLSRVLKKVIEDCAGSK